jgi:pyrrolidone-carboxylate peptidase
MAVLVTGFEPFAGPLHNPSQARLEHLPGSVFGQKLIRTQTMANHLPPSTSGCRWVEVS